MSIKVKDGIVRHNDVNYEIGEIVPGLSKEEESRLISLGVVEAVTEESDTEVPENENADTNSVDDENVKIDNSDEESDTQDTSFNVNPEEMMKAPEKAVHKKAGK